MCSPLAGVHLPPSFANQHGLERLDWVSKHAAGTTGWLHPSLPVASFCLDALHTLAAPCPPPAPAVPVPPAGGPGQRGRAGHAADLGCLCAQERQPNHAVSGGRQGLPAGCWPAGAAGLLVPVSRGIARAGGCGACSRAGAAAVRKGAREGAPRHALQGCAAAPPRMPAHLPVPSCCRWAGTEELNARLLVLAGAWGSGDGAPSLLDCARSGGTQPGQVRAAGASRRPCPEGLHAVPSVLRCVHGSGPQYMFTWPVHASSLAKLHQLVAQGMTGQPYLSPRPPLALNRAASTCISSSMPPSLPMAPGLQTAAGCACSMCPLWTSCQRAVRLEELSRC